MLALLAMQGCSTDTSANGGKKGKKGKGGDTGPVPVEVAKVIRKNVPVDITAVGNVEPLSTVSVRPQASASVSTCPTGRSPAGDQRTNRSAAPYRPRRSGSASTYTATEYAWPSLPPKAAARSCLAM